MSSGHYIKYYNSDNKLVTLHLTEGKKWSDYNVTNSYVSNIFEEVDDGDGIISADELKYLKSKLSDKNNNGIFGNNELFDSLTDIHTGGNAKDLANEIYADICTKTKYKFPTTGKDIGVHILDISPTNVKSVLKEYQKIEDKDLFSAIMNEFGLDFDLRAKYCRQIFNQLVKSTNLSESEQNKLKKEFEDEISRQKGGIAPATGKYLNQIAQKIIIMPDNKKTSTNSATSHTTSTSGGTKKNTQKADTRTPTEKHYDEIVDKITKINVDEILYDYKDEHNESLFAAIMKEIKLPPEKKISYCKQIFNKLLGYAKINKVYSADVEKRFNEEINFPRDKWTYADIERLDMIVNILYRRIETPDIKDAGETSPNGEINDFEQGNTGTCSILATIIALSRTPKGKEILKETVIDNKDGTVTVALKGAGKSYTFTQKEINNNTQLSHGDFETRAIELAFSQYFEETEQKDIDEGVMASKVYALLTGNKDGTKYQSQVTKADIENFNKENCIITCVTTKEEYDTEATNSKGEFEEIITDHAYTVIKSDENYVYLINPHDTTETIKVPISDFIVRFNSIATLDL
ncbi:hypothetical protein IJI31_05580 [bacterium]|nr:hypothetical protein [bacterium]